MCFIFFCIKANALSIYNDMSGFENPIEKHDRTMRNQMHELMRDTYSQKAGMTTRLLTRAETHAFEHCMLTMYQILDTLDRTDEISQQKIKLKELNLNIARMSKMEFLPMQHGICAYGSRLLTADNLKDAYFFINELQNILYNTEKEEKDLSRIPSFQGRENSRFRWNNGLLHRELGDVFHEISNLMDDLLPVYIRTEFQHFMHVENWIFIWIDSKRVFIQIDLTRDFIQIDLKRGFIQIDLKRDFIQIDLKRGFKNVFYSVFQLVD